MKKKVSDLDQFFFGESAGHHRSKIGPQGAEH